MSCNNRCNSSFACGISNAIIKKLIAENCGEEFEGGNEGNEEPDNTVCVASFVTAIEPVDLDNEYSITYSINGGPKESYSEENFYFLIDNITLHPTAMGKANFILNPDNLAANGIPNDSTKGPSILAGFTQDGFMAGDLDKRNLINDDVIFFDESYIGPFSFSPEVNKLEIFPTRDTLGIDLYDFFGGEALGGAPIVVKSCSTLTLGNIGKLPPPQV